MIIFHIAGANLKMLNRGCSKKIDFPFYFKFNLLMQCVCFKYEHLLIINVIKITLISYIYCNSNFLVFLLNSSMTYSGIILISPRILMSIRLFNRYSPIVDLKYVIVRRREEHFLKLTQLT